jgi:hypothetical protein
VTHRLDYLQNLVNNRGHFEQITVNNYSTLRSNNKDDDDDDANNNNNNNNNTNIEICCSLIVHKIAKSLLIAHSCMQMYKVHLLITNRE